MFALREQIIQRKEKKKNEKADQKNEKTYSQVAR